MPVYFIQAGEEGPIKIGFANNVGQRLENIQTSNHELLCVLGVIDGGLEVEKLIQQEFSRFRVRGEWFNPVPILISFIKDTCLAFLPTMRPEKVFPTATGKIITLLAEKRGVKYHTIAKWRERGYVPHKWRLVLMADAVAVGQPLPIAAFDEFGHQPEKAA